MSFNLIASCYDLLSNPQGRLEKEGPLFKNLVKEGDAVLDVACGTGPQALYLAKTCGAIVDACDLSPEMIEYASHTRPHPRITYHVRDMTQPLQGPYRLIICVGNSINLLPSRALVQQTINACIASLTPGGTYMLHVINPEAPQHQQAKKLTKQATLETGEVCITKTLTPHKSGRSLHIIYTTENGEKIKESAELLDLTHDELISFFPIDKGTITVTGTLDGNPFEQSTSPDIVIRFTLSE